VLVSETDQYWEYAKEAMLLACDAKTGRDKQEFLELARVDPDRLATAVSRDQLKRRSLGQAHWLLFSYASSVADTKNNCAKQPERPRCGHWSVPTASCDRDLWINCSNPSNLR
jgi:hypothetical protein